MSAPPPIPAIGLVVCDLAGTTVDYGSRAPAAAFVELFSRRGVRVSETEARGPMGKHKRDHIADLLALLGVASQWREKFGQVPSESDCNELFEEFLPLQTSVLDAHGDVIPGAAEVVANWRARGIKVAATTGYNRPMTDKVLAMAASAGLTFDYSICAAEVPAGRPAPWMIFRCMEATGIFPSSRVVKIGDTVVDTEEGVNAGVWTVSVSRSGNMLGLSRAEDEALDPTDRAARLDTARRELTTAGAHRVVDSIASASVFLDEFNDLLAIGRGPGT